MSDPSSEYKYFKNGDKPASKPAPCIARSAADVDEQGFPKAPIQGFQELTEEQLAEQDRKRDTILAEHAPEAPNVLQMAAKMAKAVPLKSHMSQEEFEELEYPKVPAEWDETWMQKQMAMEMVDPRVNPNLLMDENHQEFWHNAARKPLAKVIQRSEQHWQDRRNVWIKQYETVEIGNQRREQVAEMLEDCSTEVKRLVAPIMHHKITEVALASYVRESLEHQIPFQEIIEQPEKVQQLQGMRLQIDKGGDAAAARMLEQYQAIAGQRVDDNRKKLEEANRGKRITSDTDQMTKILNMGEKCKKDGYIEWSAGNIEEALSAWRQADQYLKKYKMPDHDKTGNKYIADMHLAVLKNVAQAANKQGYFTEALEAADDALRIDSQDHKAWFRRACALEGLGRYEDQREALEKIDELVVGRPDQARIQKDVEAKRAKLQSLFDRDRQAQKLGLERAVAKGIFSGEREKLPLEETSEKVEDPAALSDVPERKPRCAITEDGTFWEGDEVLVKEGFADYAQGQRGTIVEIDGDGDVRILFEGQEEAEMVLGEDLGNFRKPGGEEGEQQQQGEEAAMASTSAEAPKGLEAPPVKRRKRLTKDSALELLDALERAYGDTGFQAQLAKLMRDMRWDKVQFMNHMRRVSLEMQKPIMAKWGFDPSADGVAELQLALQDHTSGEGKDAAVKAKADAVTKLLYGEMYDVIFRPPVRAPAAPSLRPREQESSSVGS